jgi:hypothetical protein
MRALAQAFRCGVHRGRQAGRAGAHDEHVEHGIALDAGQGAEAAAHFGQGRIFQHETVRQRHERPVGRLSPVLAHELGRFRVRLRIAPRVRIRVTRKEILQLEQAGMRGRADQDRAARLIADQLHATEDERAHQALAQFGLGHDRGAQAFGVQHKGLQFAHGDAVGQRRPAGQLRHFAGELAGPVLDHLDALAERIGPAARQMPRQHDDHAGRIHAGPEHGGAVRPGAARAEAAQAGDVVGAQGRIDLVTARGQVDGGARLGIGDETFRDQFGYVFGHGRTPRVRMVGMAAPAGCRVKPAW